MILKAIHILGRLKKLTSSCTCLVALTQYNKAHVIQNIINITFQTVTQYRYNPYDDKFRQVWHTH